jgi:hypothetical protein
MFTPKGYLTETHELLCHHYPRMNKDYLLAVSEALLSASCWNVYTINDYGKLAPNIWVQMISPSGDGKTLPIDNFLVPVLEELEKQLETDDTVFKLYLADYTKEAIVKFFSNKTKCVVTEGDKKKEKRCIYTYGLLCKDEATMFLESAVHKQYMADIIAVESKIYDGKLYRRITTSRGLEEVPKCFKASLAATTPAVYDLMKTTAFIQGGWNRYDMIIGNPLSEEQVDLLPEDFFIRGRKKIAEFEGISQQHAAQLLPIAEGERIYVELDEEANLLWREFEQRMKKEAVKLEERDLRRGYLQRQAEKALKRAMLYTVSVVLEKIHLLQPETFVDFEGKQRTEKLLICEGWAMDMAIKNQEELFGYWLKMLEERKRTAISGEVRTDAAEMDYFDSKMKELSEKYGVFSRKLVIEATGFKDGDKRLTSNIDTAQQRGKLKVLTGDDSRAICNKHRNDNNMDWFAAQDINPSFRHPPYLFRWLGENQTL